MQDNDISNYVTLSGALIFIFQVQLLARVHHRNLVTLIGYCDDAQNLYLVYECMDKGTLQDHITGTTNQCSRISVSHFISLMNIALPLLAERRPLQDGN